MPRRETRRLQRRGEVCLREGLCGQGTAWHVEQPPHITRSPCPGLRMALAGVGAVKMISTHLVAPIAPMISRADSTVFLW